MSVCACVRVFAFVVSNGFNSTKLMCVDVYTYCTTLCGSYCDCYPPPPPSPRWFHGLVTRFEVEKLLDRNRPGQFLVRSTQHGKGVFAVSVRCVAYVMCSG